MSAEMKQNIAATLSRMLATQSIDKITVTHLVEECNISRQTFYYHFQDIIDVVEWIFIQTLESVLAESMKSYDPDTSLRKLVHAFHEAGPYLKNLLETQRRDQVEAILFHNLNLYLEKMVLFDCPDIDPTTKNFRLVLDYHTHALLGILCNRAVMKHVDEELLAKQLRGIYRGDLKL